MESLKMTMPTMSTKPTMPMGTDKRRTWQQIYFSRKMLAALLLGFSSGIPLGLTGQGSAFQAWMTDEHVDIAVIGLMNLVALPSTIKFLWAPFMDRYVPPFLGRRRGWILIAQVALLLAIAGMAFTHPGSYPLMFGVIAFIASFASASQDIVVDAYRTDVVDEQEAGPASSLYVLGYRLAMLVSGGVALIMSQHMSWPTVYLVMAGTIGIGIFATLTAPEIESPPKPPRTLTDAVVLPFKEFMRRTGAIEMLLFVILYKLDTNLVLSLLTVFLKSLGFANDEIGEVFKIYGVFALIAGTLLGGAIMVYLGLKRSLWVFGILQGIVGLTFVMLAKAGHSYPLMIGGVMSEQFFSGMGIAAYSAFFMVICDKRFTATQYALLTSLMAVPRVIISAATGYMQIALGWEGYFWVATFAMVPALLLLLRYDRWMEHIHRDASVHAGAAAATQSQST